MSTGQDDRVIAEALAVVDQALQDVGGRQLVPGAEVTDLLLDVRSLLAAADAAVSP